MLEFPAKNRPSQADKEERTNPPSGQPVLTLPEGLLKLKWNWRVICIKNQFFCTYPAYHVKNSLIALHVAPIQS